LRLTDAGLTLTETAAVGMRVTVAVADFVVSAVDFAVTVTVCCVVQVLGAVYMPAAEIVPVEGLTDQVTAVLLVLLTVAVNCWLWLVLRLTDAGLRPTETVAAGATVTVALADFVESAEEVAVIVTTCCEVAPLGAV
jgi:hypothetical protein